MKSYEQLMLDALEGKKGAFNDLYSYAGSGNAEAQYYLALYYKEAKGSEADYAYWMNKSKDNGYVAAQSSPIPESKPEETEQEPKIESDESLKKILMKFSFSGRINRTEYIISIVGSVLIFLFSPVVEDDIVKAIIHIVVDWFWFSQGARRLHDFGASGWYILIPVVSWIFAAFPKGDKDENEYGVAP
jgi:TPR repeat protein